jgi:hypothetical protein
MNYVRARFILDQKSEIHILKNIAKLFSPLSLSPVKLRSKKENVFRLNISCNDIKNPNITIIKNYFNKFNLKTSKHSSFLLWVHCLNLFLGQQPLSVNSALEIRKLAKKINKFTIENKSTGSSKKS